MSEGGAKVLMSLGIMPSYTMKHVGTATHTSLRILTCSGLQKKLGNTRQWLCPVTQRAGNCVG